jgi:hypothetical protein
MRITFSSALQYSLISSLARGNALVVNYMINGHAYNKRYYLGNGIYPNCSIIVKTIHNPKEKRNVRDLPRYKRLVGRMWIWHLVCSNLGGLSFNTLLEHLMLRPCRRC